MNSFSFFNKFPNLKNSLRWTLILILLSILIAQSVALFLYLLDWVTIIRQNNNWLIYLLPIAGLIIYWSYHRWCESCANGNLLILNELQSSKNFVKPLLAPLIFFTTLITHLVGGSAGREGTAIQMGGGISGGLMRFFKLNDEEKQSLLRSSIAAGFGAVFGTPLAASVFALEIQKPYQFKLSTVLSCLFSAYLAHYICLLVGAEHTNYQISSILPKLATPTTIVLVGKVILFGVWAGLAATLFCFMTDFLKEKSKTYLVYPQLIPVVGSVLIIGISALLGNNDYLGIGVYTSNSNGISIVNAFTNHNQTYWAWLYKLVLTVITLSMGFKGGEVTPLFFIGATLGNTFATIFGCPIDLFAAFGFISVFAGASNAPVASTLVGVELFGYQFSFYFMLVCFVSYVFSGKNGIYYSSEFNFKSKIKLILSRLRI
jgi:H+/Cl- antiporter ClcA